MLRLKWWQIAINAIWIVTVVPWVIRFLYIRFIDQKAQFPELDAFLGIVGAIATVIQVWIHRDVLLEVINAVRGEGKQTREHINAVASWGVDRNLENIEKVTQKRTDDIKSHMSVGFASIENIIDAKLGSNVPATLNFASQTVKNAYTALDHVDPDVRQNAVSTLSESNDKYAVEALKLAANNSMKSVRISASLALAEKTDCKDSLALSGLLEALGDSEADIQIQALQCVWQMFRDIPSTMSSDAIQKLIEVLGDRDNDVRWAAEHVLISHCDRTLPHVLQSIDHDFSKVKIAALEAIKIICETVIPHPPALINSTSILIEALDDFDQGITPREREWTSVDKLAKQSLIMLAPIQQLSEYLQNDRVWMHKYVQEILDTIKNTHL